MNDSPLELNVLGDTMRGGESGSPGEALMYSCAYLEQC